jgi:hypothetical protein
MKPHAWGKTELIEYFEKHGHRFGNPKIHKLENRDFFDLIWEKDPPLRLRWTWEDPFSVRIEKEDEGSLLAVGLAGAFEHVHHLELAEPKNSWVYVSKRFEEYPGKVKSNTIVRCLTQQGQWLKDALESGIKYLADLG